MFLKQPRITYASASLQYPECCQVNVDIVVISTYQIQDQRPSIKCGECVSVVVSFVFFFLTKVKMQLKPAGAPRLFVARAAFRALLPPSPVLRSNWMCQSSERVALKMRDGLVGVFVHVAANLA